jgi:hypothetical protein
LRTHMASVSNIRDTGSNRNEHHKRTHGKKASRSCSDGEA